MTGTDGNARSIIRWAGLVGGPVLAALSYAVLPEEYADSAGQLVVFTSAGRVTLGIMIWMALWWLTEAVDISVTALLPIALFPILGIASIKAATAPYANEYIFLFMGGFLIALSMQRWGLDRRIALITLKLVGNKPVNMIGGFMLVTAVLSAFVSNTATTAMMLPIALSVIDLVRRNKTASADRNFALCLMLGVAYAASIGGIATIIGTPPNAILAGFIKETYGETISFARWLIIGVPLAVVFLPITWFLLTRVLYPIRLERIEGGRELIAREHAQLGPMKPGEWVTLIVFLLAAIAWIFRTIIERYIPGVSDPGIAIIAAMLLFVIPVDLKKGTFTMNWSTATKLPWGILILFGGGLSLAAAVKVNGVAQFIGSTVPTLQGLAETQGLRTLLLIVLVTTGVIFLTELTSNTATTTTLLPILAAIAVGLGLHPYLLIVPAAIAASCAFMMPVATPPNAIVFGSGYITIPQMCKAGLWLNLIGIVLVTLLAYAIIIPVLGIAL
ncbi:MAG: DASS family sodium-coupled anion symporter [Planctomycetes bacterium]|nr:DASS family sodium-coupled anion symporter [Planctomycetota bacterium]